MRKYIAIFILALATAVSCQKPWSTSITLGVNNTRINIPWKQAQEQLDFTFPVYSNGEWSAQIVAGGDWLTISDNNGTGTGYIKCSSAPNTTGTVRAVLMEVKGSGKTIPVYFVISSQVLSAADLDDADLDNYLM